MRPLFTPVCAVTSLHFSTSTRLCVTIYDIAFQPNISAIVRIADVDWSSMTHLNSSHHEVK